MINMLGAAHPYYKENKVTERVIIGLSGYARSGKDEVANVLVRDFGFTRYAFADQLRDCVYALDPYVYAKEKTDEIGIWSLTFERLSKVIDQYGWDGYKESPYGGEIRSLLQRMGTEVGRDIIGEDTWVKGLDSTTGNVVVTDMRFPNEYDRVKQNDGKVWRIMRPGIEAVNAHVSETAIDDKEFDLYLANDGTLDDLATLVHNSMA